VQVFAAVVVAGADVLMRLLVVDAALVEMIVMVIGIPETQ